MFRRGRGEGDGLKMLGALALGGGSGGLRDVRDAMELLSKWDGARVDGVGSGIAGGARRKDWGDERGEALEMVRELVGDASWNLRGVEEFTDNR